MKTRLTVLSISLFLYPGQMFSQVTHFVSPTYPVLARQARIEGIVTAEVRLTPAGTVDSVESSAESDVEGRGDTQREAMEIRSRKDANAFYFLRIQVGQTRLEV